ncbi:hypothetical protein BKA83DRAFT_4129359 [Pisolithus microcarpus]|nr:hypothetical protein BKA83DRAFT_4129359 [Pisolithus microcarpus]
MQEGVGRHRGSEKPCTETSDKRLPTIISERVCKRHTSASNYQQHAGMGGSEKVHAEKGDIRLPTVISNYQHVGMRGSEKIQAETGDICLPTIISNYQHVSMGGSEKIQAETGDICLPTIISKPTHNGHFQMLPNRYLSIVIYMLSMARTTQNAKKTTSGSARRVRLSVKHAHMIAGSMAKDISSRAAKGKSTKRTSRSMSMESISSLSSLTTLLSSPVHHAILLDSSREMLPWATNRQVFVLLRFLSTGGLEEVKPELYASDIKFKCPGCHELREREVKCKLSPYHCNIHTRLSREMSMENLFGCLTHPQPW